MIKSCNLLFSDFLGIQLCRTCPSPDYHLLLSLWRNYMTLQVSPVVVAKVFDFKLTVEWRMVWITDLLCSGKKKSLKTCLLQFRRRVTWTFKSWLKKKTYWHPLEILFKRTQPVLYHAVGLLLILLPFWFVEKIISKTIRRCLNFLANSVI